MFARKSYRQAKFTLIMRWEQLPSDELLAIEKVIVMSGNFDEYELPCRERGCSTIIAKPFEASALSTEVRRACKHTEPYVTQTPPPDSLSLES